MHVSYLTIANTALAVLCITLSAGLAEPTGSFFTDEAAAVSHHSITAGTLNMGAGGSPFSESVTPGDTSRRTVTVNKEGNIGFRYAAGVRALGDSFCDDILLSVQRNGETVYSGPLSGFESEPVAHEDSADEWVFEASLGGQNAAHLQGKTCNFDIVFDAWQTQLPSNMGFRDTEYLPATVSAGYWKVVLNEFLPNPANNEDDGGYNFGEDSYYWESGSPVGEWGEIYNRGSAPVDVNGWHIEDAAGTEVPLSADNIYSGTTVLPAGGSGNAWLVAFLNHNRPLLNNDGDTITLVDDNGTVVDSYTYTQEEFCNLEPTPGSGNATSAENGGNCDGAEAPENKSWARIPDGNGDWVDPLPTPGAPNHDSYVAPTLSRSEEDDTNGAVTSDDSETTGGTTTAATSTSASTSTSTDAAPSAAFAGTTTTDAATTAEAVSADTRAATTTPERTGETTDASSTTASITEREADSGATTTETEAPGTKEADEEKMSAEEAGTEETGGGKAKDNATTTEAAAIPASKEESNGTSTVESE